MWLIAGLGNPGTRYARNRHNMGFRVVDCLARRHSAAPFRSKFGGELTNVTLNLDRALLLKPMEFMNVSGHAVQRTATFYNVEPSRLIVVHDEIDFPMGRLKVKSGGGHGGHNGVRSIIDQLGDRSFSRIRIGVGRPERHAQADGSGGGAGDGRVSKHVLADFPSSMEAEVDELAARAADAVEAIIARGVVAAMNEYNADPTKDGDESNPSDAKDGDRDPKTD